jgi:hypothetical protein
MPLSGAAEVAVLIPLIAMVWAAGAAWIKAWDYIETRRSNLQRSRTRQAMRSVRE